MQTLFLINDMDEAQQALKVFDSRRDVLMALTLEAEFCLKSKIDSWQNPLYKFLDLYGPTCNYNFLLPNFETAYNFAKGGNLDGIRDRLGYFFSEFDRSYQFADKVIRSLKPEKIVAGIMKDYPGSSVINGSLKIHAFDVVSRERRILRKCFSQKSQKKSLRQILGEISNKIVTFKRVSPAGSYDLVILAPPRHIFQLESVIGGLKKAGLKILILTYTLTPTYRSLLNKHIGKYLEKERLITEEVEQKSKKLIQNLINSKPWNKFSHPKYKSKREVQKFLQDKIKHVTSYELLENIRDKFVAYKFFNQVSCRALLTTTDPDSKVMHFISAAKISGIETIALQHGVMWSPAPPSVLPLSDKFIVWSDISKQWIRKIDGANNIDIIVGQSPFHQMRRGQKLKRIKGPLKILYLATIVILDINMVAYWQRKFFEILEQFGNCEVVVRVHPFQDTNNLSAIMSNFRIRATFDKNENLGDSIANSDLVIFEETTAGFDAMLAGKPTIFFNPFSQEDYFEAKKRDYAMTILSQEDLDARLLKYLNESGKWKYFRNHGKFFAQKYLGISSMSSNKLVNTIVSQVPE